MHHQFLITVGPAFKLPDGAIVELAVTPAVEPPNVSAVTPPVGLRAGLAVRSEVGPVATI